ncbi:uncharacterized protein P884DRAFT_46421 [Thermothelomyces heterothallicus CBS 202.75]|uniref:uncharacterized protein n=1 Tax=Thermothelomyces heterothallicus CBS 202.75 TaxID=1149848 RepID=UPI003742EB92
MLSALLRPFKGSSSQAEDPRDLEHDSAFPPSVAEYRSHPHATADFTEADDDDEESNDGERHLYPLGGRPEQHEDGLARFGGLLPLFATNHLDSIPIYSMTHAIRVVVQTRTETTLTWDQLRSPQVSAFLIKPMLQQIRTQHFSCGTLYALLANCLQFGKEEQLCLGNAGTSATRARVCELLAIKLLKEYSPRDLIDALCHDFYPLQGIPGSRSPLASPAGKSASATLRTSALEVAIRASAKQFLSHPLVVQQIEGIWNGAITFSSSTRDPRNQGSEASAAGSNQSRRQSTIRTPLLGDQRAKDESARSPAGAADCRSVTLYNPRTASLFKLSRLRVPRYRRLLSTCSLIVLVCLFLAVLAQRSGKITTLELLFWFWSAGFMLDDLVGFNEEGFSFYVMSFWNIFDLGLLLLLIVYYCMRIYGVFLLDPHKWNQNAYDVLAVDAILMLPRIFGMLDHYRHFSRLLISLRLLARDLASVFVLTLAFCSGFFAFFAFSKTQDDAPTMAYKMFQMLLGFTPSAWELWPTYNWMGKVFLVFFLVISHFMIMTLLIVVLANSFMSVASKAAEEYQFAFAINTISMAKNDAPFSYIAPGNIFAWALMPLRYCMSMDRYVLLNRAVIKITHFPVLFCIYLYEKLFLAPDMYEATGLVDRPHRGRHRSLSDHVFFSPSVRVREESMLRYRKDQALEEVFRRAPDMRTQRRAERRKTQTAIRSWMDQHDGKFHSPQNYSTIDSRISSDWLRRLSMNRERPARVPKHYSDIRSTASDPVDILFDPINAVATDTYDAEVAKRDYPAGPKENTDGEADGDDELITNDEDEADDVTNTMDDRTTTGEEAVEEDYFTTPVATRFTSTELTAESPRPPTSRRVPFHTRTLSTNTILHAPEDDSQAYSSSSASARPLPRPLSTRHTPVATPITPGTGRRSPRRSFYLPPRPRSMIQPSETVPRAGTTRGSSNNLRLYIPTAQPPLPPRRRSLADLLVTTSAEDSYNTMNLHGEKGEGKPSSPPACSNSNSTATAGEADLNRLMLARMQSLEQSLGCMVQEMRTLRRRKSMPNTAWDSDEDIGCGRSGKRYQHQHQHHHHRDHDHGHHHQHHHYQQHHQQHGQERQRRYQHQSRRAGVAGSDPSSVVSAGQSLIEVAAAVGRDRERGTERTLGEGGGGGRRAGGAPPGMSAVSTPTSRRAAMTPGRKGGGAWRSPRGDGESAAAAAAAAAAGLGIREAVEGRTAKGKERETVGKGLNGEDSGVGGNGEGSEVGVSPGTRSGMSPERDDIGISPKGGTSL